MQSAEQNHKSNQDAGQDAFVFWWPLNRIALYAASQLGCESSGWMQWTAPQILWRTKRYWDLLSVEFYSNRILIYSNQVSFHIKKCEKVRLRSAVVVQSKVDQKFGKSTINWGRVMMLIIRQWWLSLPFPICSEFKKRIVTLNKVNIGYWSIFL